MMSDWLMALGVPILSILLGAIYFGSQYRRMR